MSSWKTSLRAILQGQIFHQPAPLNWNMDSNITGRVRRVWATRLSMPWPLRIDRARKRKISFKRPWTWSWTTSLKWPTKTIQPRVQVTIQSRNQTRIMSKARRRGNHSRKGNRTSLWTLPGTWKVVLLNIRTWALTTRREAQSREDSAMAMF